MILVAGAGAIGGWLGARLAAAGHDVTLLGRPGLASAVASGGLRVSGHTTFAEDVPVITEPTGTYDTIWLTCKAHQTASLGAAVAPLLAPDGVLVTLQNGLGNAEKLARHVPADRIAVALTSHGVTVESPGRLRHAGTGMFQAGPAPQHAWNDAAGRAWQQADAAGLDPARLEDTRAAVWTKAIVNAGINPVAALHGVPNGAVLERPEWLALTDALVRESVLLAERARVKITGDLVETTQAVLQGTAENRCSMLQDVEAGRPTEIEQITGRMVRLAETLLCPMPRSESVYGRIKDLETSYLGAEASEATAWAELQTIGTPV